MKFNVNKEKNQVRNYENAPAHPLSPEWNLYTSVVTSSLSDKFYESASDRIEKLRRLIQENDTQWVARLAIYAREQMNLRSIPLVLVAELTKIHSGDALVSRTITRIIQRADEITELLAYYQLSNERKGTKKLNRLSKQLQAGLQNAFNKFDEYQFAKYNREGEIKLKDALFLVHPKAKDEEQQSIFNKIATDSLQTPYTWETELSALGQNKFESEEAKKAAFTQKWEELIESGKVGYMALLRNLRNLLEAEVSLNHIHRVCETVSSKEKVRTSKQLPFRFLAAYRELSKINSGYASQVMNALEEAVKISAENINGFDESTKVVVACDVSGSMQRPISPKSKVMNYDIGLMLGMLLKSRCKNVVSGLFGDTWKIVNLPNNGILSNVDAFYKREGEVGYSTNGYLVIQDLIDRKKEMDKIMLFTDCQLWNSKGGNIQLKEVWKKYKTIAPKAKLYLFDLAGYGQTPLDITNDDVYLIAGWSDKIFNILSAIENGSDALKEIKAIEI
ncbi:MAG: TROVE domain-containing protein [Candidatus Azobacteroides sp.]|nr:TROVE domain-containing protein [Candidatus Azobacteroides sp.]